MWPLQLALQLSGRLGWLTELLARCHVTSSAATPGHADNGANVTAPYCVAYLRAAAAATAAAAIAVAAAAAAAAAAGVPYKGYDERAPHDGYRMAAGMNELFTAPLLAKQKGSYDWDESINAITRHVIEEFSNLQHFVPYLYEKCNLLGKAGFNWVPTLGTWLQHNNQLKPDSTSISFYNTLEKMATLQVMKL
jgi:hypothetical protein